MPRKKTIQPEPSEILTLEDGTIAKIRHHETREIGRGQDKKFNSEAMDNQVLVGLFDDLVSGEPWRHTQTMAFADAATSSPLYFERWCGW